nr:MULTISPECIES: radical SAM protein [unclassified Oceanispirochaeta]
METKRGCPYSCSYCAHDTVHKRSIIEKSVSDALSEIDFLVHSGITKINIIDPVFNSGSNYLKIADNIAKTQSPTLFSIQYRLQKKMKAFLKLCQKGKICFEVGIQSLDPKVLHNINRFDDPYTNIELLQELEDHVPFEISIIYGLPGQTLQSFEDTIARIQSVTRNPIRAFPLMLLPGTRLYLEKEKWQFKEEVDEYGITYVIESNSMTTSDWMKMDLISKELS